MRFRLILGFGLFTAAASLAAPGVATAATASCMSPDGSCEVSNDPFDWTECMCANGVGGGGGGGNAWAGLSEMDLQPICEAELLSLCGMQPPPPAGIPCGTANGQCEISNQPFDWIECTCADGSNFGGGGGNAWGGLSEAELIMICESSVDMNCGGAPPPPPPPPPPGVECTNEQGICTIFNDPEDAVFCECADGTGHDTNGGNTWADLPPEQLELECLDQLDMHCSAEDTEGTSTGEPPGDTGETGDTGHDESTTGEPPGTTTGEPGDASGSTSGGTGLDTGDPPPNDDGGTTGTSGTGSDDAGADGDDGSGGKGGCTVATDGAPRGAAMTLLGLALGWRRRRRRR